MTLYGYSPYNAKSTDDMLVSDGAPDVVDVASQAVARVRVKVVPAPTVLVTSMVPP
jgi:hypothetical protein